MTFEKTRKGVRRQLFLGAAVAALAPAALVTTIVVSAPAAAQDYSSGALSGSVIDQTGSALADATISLTSDRGFTRSATSSSDGDFRIPQLPVGGYTLTVSKGGYDTQEREIRIIVGKTTVLNVVVPVTGALAEDTIVVTGQRAGVSDFDANTGGLVIDVGDLSAKVPVARNLNSVALLAPGAQTTDVNFAVGGNRGSASTQISLAGGSVGENVFYVNGFNITDFRDFIGASRIPFEFYEQIEVKSGGFPAEFGRSTGGVINAVTKSGSNEWHGGFNFYYEPDEIRSDSPDTYENNNRFDQRMLAEGNLWLSGPIIQDRVFFYALYNPRNREQVDWTTSTAFNRRETDPFYGGKLDVVLTQDHLLEYTFWHDKSEIVADTFELKCADGTVAPCANAAANPAVAQGNYAGTLIDSNGGDTHIAKYSGKFADWLTVSALYGHSTYDNTNSSNTSTVPASFDGSSLARFTPYAVLNIRNAENVRELYRADVDVFVNDFFGEHHILLGFDQGGREMENAEIYTGPTVYFPSSPNLLGAVADTTFDANGGTGYTLTTTGASISINQSALEGTLRVRENIGAFKTTQRAYYLQDAWIPSPGLTLNLGVRWELFDNKSIEGQSFAKIDNMISPRFGFSYDPGDDGVNRFYGSWGRYFLPVATNTNLRLAGAERDSQIEFTYDPNQFDPSNPINTDGSLNVTYLPSTYQIFSDGIPDATFETVSANLSAQHVDEWIVGVEHRVPDNGFLDGIFEDWTFGLRYVHRKLFNGLEDAAVDAAVLQYCTENNISGCSSVWTGFHHYVLINPGNDIVYSTDDAPISTDGQPVEITIPGDFLPPAQRLYKALEFTFQRPWDGDWALQGSYVWSDLEGNYEGSVKSDNGQTDAGLTTDYDQPGLTDGSYGKLPNHRAHTFKVWGTVQVIPQIQMGFNASITSPRKFGCIGRHPTDAFAGAYGVASWYCVPDGTGGDLAGETVAEGRARRVQLSRLTPRGSQLEIDWIKNVNMSLAYSPQNFDYGSLQFRVDVFNLFNFDGVADIEERGENTNPRWSSRTDTDGNLVYGSPRAYQSPRRVRFGVDYRF